MAPMKNYFLFLVAINAVAFISCSKKQDANVAESLVGKWVLTKSCVCSSCTDSNAVDNNQTLLFSSDGQVQISGSVGDTEQHYSGTYTVTPQAYGKVLYINVDPGGPENFLYIPGSIILSESATTLVLNLNTPFANACLYQNTYVAVSH